MTTNSKRFISYDKPGANLSRVKRFLARALSIVSVAIFIVTKIWFYISKMNISMNWYSINCVCIFLWSSWGFRFIFVSVQDVLQLKMHCLFILDNYKNIKGDTKMTMIIYYLHMVCSASGILRVYLNGIIFKIYVDDWNWQSHGDIVGVVTIVNYYQSFIRYWVFKNNSVYVIQFCYFKFYEQSGNSTDV